MEIRCPHCSHVHAEELEVLGLEVAVKVWEDL